METQLRTNGFELRLVGHGAISGCLNAYSTGSVNVTSVDDLGRNQRRDVGIGDEFVQQIGVEAQPDHRSRIERLFAAAARRSMRAPIVDCRLAGTSTSSAAADRVRARLAVQHTAFSQIAHHLLCEERVSGGTADDPRTRPSSDGWPPTSSVVSDPWCARSLKAAMQWSARRDGLGRPRYSGR